MGYVIEPRCVTTPGDMFAFSQVLDGDDPAICVNYTTRNNDQTVRIPSTGETVTLYRFREGIERFLITDINNPAAGSSAASMNPIMWDSVRTNNGAPEPNQCNHLPLAANVPFLDGHIEYARYPQPPNSPFYMLTQAAQTDNATDFP